MNEVFFFFLIFKMDQGEEKEKRKEGEGKWEVFGERIRVYGPEGTEGKIGVQEGRWKKGKMSMR